MINFLFYDLRCSLRSAGGPIAALAVFLLALIMFPLLMGPEIDILHRVGPSLMWLMAAMASLLYAPSALQEDIEDGTLIQLRLITYSTLTIFLFKSLNHYLLVGIPIILLSFAASPFYGLNINQTLILAWTFIIALPAISFLSILGSTLCIGARGGNLLIMLLILPLMLPLFIFALSAVDAIGLNLPANTHLKILTGISILGSILAICAGQYILKEVE